MLGHGTIVAYRVSDFMLVIYQDVDKILFLNIKQVQFFWSI